MKVNDLKEVLKENQSVVFGQIKFFKKEGELHFENDGYALVKRTEGGEKFFKGNDWMKGGLIEDLCKQFNIPFPPEEEKKHKIDFNAINAVCRSGPYWSFLEKSLKIYYLIYGVELPKDAFKQIHGFVLEIDLDKFPNTYNKEEVLGRLDGIRTLIIQK